MNIENIKLAVIGLGYVGLPLAVEFGKVRPVIGFDINRKRIRDLQSLNDQTLEVDSSELVESTHLVLTDDEAALQACNCFIVTVPTPIDVNNKPDLAPLLGAAKMVARRLKLGDLVIFESTVYPGCTEDVCVPIMEEISGLRFNEEFFVGYSPERINPGDKTHRLTMVTKVTSGSTPYIADLVDALYRQIITAGTHRAESIKIAEAAKVIENTQRDLNIALINELAIIFNKMGIDTKSVLDAASSKWNFLPFKPGLVGGHCIGVDPYYLTFKAEEMGYQPEIILAGRRLNNHMSTYVAELFLQKMAENNIELSTAKILILGLTFKENCPDLRNSRIYEIINLLKQKVASVDVYDPNVVMDRKHKELGVSVIGAPKTNCMFYDGIMLAVPHAELYKLGAEEIHSFGKKCHIFFDVKSVFEIYESDLRL